MRKTLAWLLVAMMCNLGLGQVAMAGDASRTCPGDAGTGSSDESIFRGIFFGAGPVADLFPEIWQNPKVVHYVSRLNSPETQAAQEHLLTALRTADPTFLARFGASMRSGDHLRVEQALQETAERLKTQLQTQLGSTPDPDMPPVESDNVLVVVVLAVAAVVAAVVFFVATGPTDGGKSTLRRDTLVHLIATRLGPAALR